MSKAFDNIKKCLSSPIVLGTPVSDKPILLYIATQERSLGALCAQEHPKGKERALYYMILTFVGPQLNY